MISHNPHDCPFLLQVMDKEIGPGLTQGHRAGPGSTEGQLLGEAESYPRYCVLCQVWAHCSFHVVAKVGTSPKFTEWQDLSLGFQSCCWVRSPLRKEIHFLILIPVEYLHYFCILCIILGELSDYQFFECASIRYQCIVESCNTGNIRLSQQGFHANRAEFIHLKKKKKKTNIWGKVLPSHIFFKHKVQVSWSLFD